MVWNKKQKVTRKGTKALRKRDEREWLTRRVEGLAIVDQNLWKRVQTRLAEAGAKYLRATSCRLIGSPSGMDVGTPYLLSGIGECGLCHGSLVAMTRDLKKKRAPYYGCTRYHKRGVHACRNGLQIRQDVLDAAVADVLVKALEPEVVDEAVRSAVKELQADAEALKVRRQTDDRRAGDDRRSGAATSCSPSRRSPRRGDGPAAPRGVS